MLLLCAARVIYPASITDWQNRSQSHARFMYQFEISALDLLLLKEERLISHKSKLLIIHDLLRTSDKEHSSLDQRLVELRVDLILCLIGKIDYNIAADDQIAA